MGDFKRISIGNVIAVMSDMFIYDSDFKEIVFASMLGYSTQVEANLKELNLGVAHCYTSSIGSLRTSKERYIYEMKKQNDSDYVHAIAYLADNVEQTEAGEIIDCLIFCKCEDDVENELFNKLSEYSSVPILREWMPYIKSELLRKRHLRAMSISSKEETQVVAYRLMTTKSKMKVLVADGLYNRMLNINGINTPSEIMKTIKGLDSYLNSFGEILAEKIQNSFKPKFIPGEDPYDEYTNNVDDSIASAGIEMYEAQKSVVQATVNNLKVNDATFVIGEMGSGKSLIGSCIPYAHHANKKVGFNAITICPAHLASKWKRESERAVPNSKAFIIDNFSHLKSLEPRLRNKRKAENTFIIVTKEKAKMGYDLRPAAVWSKRLKTFVCPDCGQELFTIEHEGSGNDRRTIHVPFDELSMNKKLVFNSKCMNHVKVWDEELQRYVSKKCDTKLWTPLNRDEVNSKWIKLGKEGWILKEHIMPLTEMYMQREKLNKKDTALFKRLFEQYELINNGEEPHVTYKGPKKYAISKYIREKMSDVFDYAIIDEAHQYKGLTEQGQAAADIMQVSKKSILLTGTLLNGYADGLFYLLYRTVPKLMIKDGFGFKDELNFARTYGVYSRESKEQMIRGKAPRRIGAMKEKRLPGVSPLVFTKFLLNNSVFLSLSDMSDGLPEYEEIPVPVNMDSEVSSNYFDLEAEFRNIAGNRNESKKILGALLQALTVYPDAPHCADPLLDPETGEISITPKKLPKRIREKELALLDLVKERIANGEKVLVYYSSVNKTDIGSTLTEFFNENNINAYEMKSSVDADSREEWVEKHIDKGMDVLICNPALVETGLDLLDFTSIIFYQIGYNLFTMRQASRRSWRLSQTNPVKVFFMYYRNSIQEQALSLMATKLQASMAIEGKFSEEGLRAMSQNEDMLTQIANNVVEGIKDTVNEELFKAASFVKASSREERYHEKTRAQLECKMNEDGIKTVFGSKFKALAKRKAVNSLSDDKASNILKLFC